MNFKLDNYRNTREARRNFKTLNGKVISQFQNLEKIQKIYLSYEQ